MSTAAAAESVYLTPPEIARRLRVSQAKVLAWIHSGRLPAVNTSGGCERPRYRVHEADLEAFLAGLAVHAAPPATRRRRAPQTDVIDYFPDF